jgi:hypothetical protein
MWNSQTPYLLTPVSRGCETFHVWKMFAESGHADKTFRHSNSIGTVYKPLVNYFLDMTTIRFAWMVDLTLNDVYCSRLDLRQLAILRNIQTLVSFYPYLCCI